MEHQVKEGRDASIKDLILDIASKEPVPGGGAVSALSAAMACALVSMVLGLTMGKKAYLALSSDVKEELLQIFEKANALKGDFLDWMGEDNRAFMKVMEAFQYPKETAEDIGIRTQKIKDAYLGAMEVPLKVAKTMSGFYIKMSRVAPYANTNCLSDFAVASLQAKSAIRGAILNVRVNTGGIGREELAAEVIKECHEMEVLAESVDQEIQDQVEKRLGA
jgi:methenyltetrahydrofolate cyclohydrolase